MMREAVSLMGGYGITEDCPGFLGHKWMDAQLEATYEGPEAVQRRQLTVTMTSEVFLAQFRAWTARDAPHRLASAPAPAHAPWPPPCSCGSGRSTTCRTPPTPTAASSITASARALPSPWPTRSAGCSPRAARSSTSLELEARGADDPSSPRASPAPCSSSPTSATCRRRRLPARSAASAPSWSSATTRHPAWDDAGCTELLSGRRARGTGRDHARHHRHAIDVSTPTAAIRKAALRWLRGSRIPPRRQARSCLTVAAGQGPRRRDRRKVMIPKPWTTR